MKKVIQFILLCTLFTSSAQIIFGQSLNKEHWKKEETSALSDYQSPRLKQLPKMFSVLRLDYENFARDVRKNAELSRSNQDEISFEMLLPNPEGKLELYQLTETSAIDDKVAHLYTVKTFKGHAKDDVYKTVRCAVSETGFNAFVFDGVQSYSIETYDRNSKDLYIVYYKSEHVTDQLRCDFMNNEERKVSRKSQRNAYPNNLKTYKLAYVSSGEFSDEYGGMPYSATNVLNTIAMGLNLVNEIYERDLGIHFNSVTNSNLIYTNPATDPFDYDDKSVMLQANHDVCVAELGLGGFDVGHLLIWANVGGVAVFGVCNNNLKGKGFSGSDASFNSIFVDYSCHEIGHQFGGDHNFVSAECGTSEDDLRFEPGEGSTIMSYAGVCGDPASYQNISDPYFHSISMYDIENYIDNQANCYAASSPGGGNASPPEAEANGDITIPKETPFVLVGSVTDGNDASGNLTMTWEQYDGFGAAASGPPDCSSEDQPLFRYSPPSNNVFRVLPAMSEVLSGLNNSVTWEKLPCAPRTIYFNFNARDNNPNWGRTGNEFMEITVEDTGPFAVSYPNGAETLNEGGTPTITWTENGTSAHCPMVDILLSKDNGVTFTILASAVVNDGSQSVTLPSGSSSDARILIQCSVGGNFKSASTFFDVSDAVFNIQIALPVDLVDFKVERFMDKKVNVIWATENENNNQYFDVERSQDGYDFHAIGRINGFGNSTIRRNYSFIDDLPLGGLSYYRLKQVDLGGEFDFSQIRPINFSGLLSTILVYPNPSSGLLSVQIADNELGSALRIYDQIGRLVHSSILSKPTIDISNLPNGLYHLSLTAGDKTYLEKVIINK